MVRDSNRMTIAYLLALSVGIAVSITAMRAVERIRFPADQWYYLQDSTSDIDARGWLVAFIYGLCLTTFLYAYRSGQIWQSPGKILAIAVRCDVRAGLESGRFFWCDRFVPRQPRCW